jgi:hypothetical protein
MHTGVLMAVRQFLGQYLVYAKPWQRALIAGAVMAGAVALSAAGIVTGDVTMTVIGGLLLLGTGNACGQIIRARRRRGRERRSAWRRGRGQVARPFGGKRVLGMFEAIRLSLPYG